MRNCAVAAPASPLRRVPDHSGTRERPPRHGEYLIDELEPTDLTALTRIGAAVDGALRRGRSDP